MAANEGSEPQEEWGQELLLYGQEQILRGADTAVLVAFAAMAFQELRGGEKLPHHNLAFGLLLISVLFCAIVHFTLGNAYVSRGKKLLRKQKEAERRLSSPRVFTTLSYSAGILQLLFVVAGLILLFLPETP